jgi:hypothetical protein
MSSADLDVGTIFIGKHFTSNALCISDDSVAHLIHISYLLTINFVSYKPQNKNPEYSNLDKEGPLLSLS